MTDTLKPNSAKTNPDGTEVQKIVPIDSGNAPASGQPTTPGTAAGSLVNTTLDRMNNSLAHVCDFSLETQKNNALKKFLVAQAKNIREAVRSVMRALGLSDATGQYQWLFNKLKALTRELKWIQKNVIQPILDFEKYVKNLDKNCDDLPHVLHNDEKYFIDRNGKHRLTFAKCIGLKYFPAIVTYLKK